MCVFVCVSKREQFCNKLAIPFLVFPFFGHSNCRELIRGGEWTNNKLDIAQMFQSLKKKTLMIEWSRSQTGQDKLNARILKRRKSQTIPFNYSIMKYDYYPMLFLCYFLG